MTTELEIQNIEIYLDYATIPSLNYFLDFAEHKDDDKTIRLFGLARFAIPESIINLYPEGIIRYIPVSNADQKEFNNEFNKLLSEKNAKLNLCFHLNLFHSFNMFIPLLGICVDYIDKIESISLNFYDDGSEGIVYLAGLEDSNIDLEKEILNYQTQLEKFFIEKELKIKHRGIFRYLWNTIYPSHYTLLRTDYLEQSEKLYPIKNRLDQKYKEMNLRRFFDLSEEQKDFLLTLLSIPNELNTLIKELNEQEKIFIFIGTTLFQDDQSRLRKFHFEALLQYIDPKSRLYIGDGYTVCYKGHPHSKEINSEIIKEFKNIICLPEHIPLEIFLLLGLKPHKIGGFASTSYFFLDKKDIQNVMFLTEKGRENENYLFRNQYILSKLMVKLGYITSSQVYYIS